jgi:chromosome segregation ATPase
LRTNEKLDVNDLFVERLTHSAYFIQTLRIKPSYNTRLEKLLSIFEQANFIGSGTSTKGLKMEEDDQEFKELLNILRYAAADEKTRKELDEEEYYLGAMDEMFGDKDRELAETKVKLEKSNKAREELGEKHEELGEKYEELGEKHEELGKKHEELGEKYADFQRKMAKRLKNAGISPKEISDETGMSVDEIESL